jgi:hypothetical protein
VLARPASSRHPIRCTASRPLAHPSSCSSTRTPPAGIVSAPRNSKQVSKEPDSLHLPVGCQPPSMR